MPSPPGVVRRFLSRHPWALETGVVGAYLLLSFGLAVESLAPPVAASPWIPVALTTAGVAVLVFRHRMPVLMFAAAMLLFMASAAWGTAAEIVLPLFTLYAVGAHRSSLTAWLCFAVAVVAQTLTAWIFIDRDLTGAQMVSPTRPPMSGDPVSDTLNLAAGFVVVVLVATLLGVNAGERRRYVSALLERAAQLVRDRDQQAEIARSNERERIAREMHDVIAHSLSVMIALADGASAAAPDRPQLATDAMSRVADTGRRTLGEVRRLLATVRTDESAGASALTSAPAAGAAGAAGAASASTVAASAAWSAASASSRAEQGAGFEPQPGAAQLVELVAEFREAGLPAQLVVTGIPPAEPADPALELTVYRIVQESLTNVLRHAVDPSRVEAEVEWLSGADTGRGGSGARILVRDNGANAAKRGTAITAATGTATSPGTSSGPALGRGLIGMTERATLFGGTVEAGPGDDGGWRVSAVIGDVNP